MNILDRLIRKKNYGVSREAYELTQDAFVADLHGHTYMADRLPQLLNYFKIYANPEAKKMDEGGISLQAFSVVPSEYKKCRMEHILKKIVAVNKIVAKSSRLEWALSGTEAEDVWKKGKIGAFIGMESMHTLEGNLENLRWLHMNGVRYASLTHFIHTQAGYSSLIIKDRGKGITNFGRKAIGAMNRLGMIVDIAHLNYQGSFEAIKYSKDPVITSHTGIHTVDKNRRNIDDTQIKAIADSGGVIGICFLPWFMGWQITDIFGRVADHIERVRDVGGIECIALGSDFTGLVPTSLCPTDASQIPVLTQILMDRRYPEEDIRKILGLNFLRVYKEVCG